MSVVPLRFREWWDDFERPVSSLMDQHFGRGWFRDDLISRLSDWSMREPRHHFDTYYRPWRSLFNNRDSGLSTVKSDKDKFQVSVPFKGRSAWEQKRCCEFVVHNSPSAPGRLAASDGTRLGDYA